jgi:hypothetical protein
MMKLSHICHSKLMLECINHLTKELSGGGSENNIIHVQQQVGGVRAPAVDEQ